MGKGSRNRVAYEQEKLAKREALIKEQKKQKMNKRITIAVVALLLVAAIVGGVFGVAGSIKAKNRTEFHNTVAVSSKNYEVTAAMMSYFVNLQYMNFQSNYAQQLSQIQLDTTKSLKEQPCDPQFAEDSKQTWFDYFYNIAEDQVVDMLNLLEGAKQDGFALSDTDKETLKTAEEELKKAYEENDMTEQEYLDYVYGKGMKKEEVMKAMEYYQLSSSYYNHKYASKKYTDDEINSQYNSNKKLFTAVDYLAYSFSASLTSYGDDKVARNAAISSLKSRAEFLTKVKSAAEFKSELKAYLDKAYNKNATYTTVDPDEELKNSDYKGITFIEDNEICDWAFDDARKVGEIQTFEEEIEGVYYVSVVMMTKTMYRDETVTRDIRHILYLTETYGTIDAAKEKAKTLLDLYKSGEQTEERFAALATENTEDPGSQRTGGLYEGVKQGEMVPTFNDWMFDKNRKKGDTGIVESSYGCHIMYYPDNEKTVWQTSVKNKLINDAFEADIKELTEKYSIKAKNQDIVKAELDY